MGPSLLKSVLGKHAKCECATANAGERVREGFINAYLKPLFLRLFRSARAFRHMLQDRQVWIESDCKK